MIDKIKFDLPVNKIQFDSFEWVSYVPVFKNGKKVPKRYSYYKRRIYKGRGRFLTVKIRFNKLNREYKLTVVGSIRKWYFGKNSRQNLTFTQFEECIKLLSIELRVKEAKLWKANITQLENGVTVVLTHKYKKVLDCFIKYINFERQIIGETTLYFNGENYRLMMYDKFKEKNNGKVLNKNQALVDEKLYIFRFEIKVTKVSGVNFYNVNAKTLNKIRRNWNKLANQIYNYYNEIIFVDIYSPTKKVSLSSYPDLKQYLIFEGMQSLGIQNLLEMFDVLELGTNKSRYFKSFISHYQLYITNGNRLKDDIGRALTKKINQILI